AGSSGQTSGVKGVHPSMLYTLSIAGSLSLDFDGPRLDVSFVDTNGWTRDHFSIVKGAATPKIADNATNGFVEGAISFPLSPVAPEQMTRLCTVPSSERETLLGIFRTTTNA